MKLSVIIVNYNVKHFVTQCLYSVQKAMSSIEAEVIVVDNNSVDGSCAEIKEKFPWSTLIENKKNVGFAKANNQAIEISRGEHVLLLNPDTIVMEDTFTKCLEFMDNKPEAGMLGVKMIDGKGNFLPESKRALPTPVVAFYKIFGLSSLFPRSKRFGKYHLSYLDKRQTHEVEVISGAFMFIRKKALEKSGNLDEDFFMYGEDIDLSYRVMKAGYKNYYYPGTTIIHYKGESTKKGSLNYVIVFYKAMVIFANKHFSRKNAKIISKFINFAIYLRAGLSILKRFISNMFLPALDGAIIYSAFYIGLPFWEDFRFNQTSSYPDLYLNLVVPSYIIIWIIAIFLSGGYEKPVKFLKILRGIGVGSIIILVIYALLPEDFRFSRALILLGTTWAVLSMFFSRAILNLTGLDSFKFYNNRKKKILIVGKDDEAKRVHSLINQVRTRTELLGIITPAGMDQLEGHIGTMDQLDELVKINKTDEIIFCARDISSQDIIHYMMELVSNQLEFKIAPPETLSIIGSNSINAAGELYTINFNSILKDKNKRNKRLLDIFVSLLLLAMLPVHVFFVKNKTQLVKNILKVLVGSSSWVGYFKSPRNYALPKIKPGVLQPADGLRHREISNDLKEKLNILYAKDYKLLNDVNIIMKGIKKTDRVV